MEIVLEKLEAIEDLLKSQKTVLTIDDLTTLSGLSKSTIYKFTCTNKIPHYKRAKHLYFDRVEIENWLKSKRIKTTEELDSEAGNYVTLNSIKS
ncbi:Helix-turn-helix domain-containing protein [Ekhidna lutea]|uniref:Helix-turn-helix domain-containing protein n=1 Tax=Ekhidna lutea TaxID=447679 RepID=A0A239F819_EKHLU|nr:helix-turn-helix domain-containing protein [Ekhidna lutea]SNS53036.1 Helix-turn-helix domain-containing protein [Ekhidna lutea]